MSNEVMRARSMPRMTAWRTVWSDRIGSLVLNVNWR